MQKLAIIPVGLAGKDGLSDGGDVEGWTWDSWWKRMINEVRKERWVLFIF